MIPSLEKSSRSAIRRLVLSGIISLKGNRYGLSVNITQSASFEEIKKETADYFKSASKMFGNEKIALSFEGKPLSNSERSELCDIIRDNCSLNILCVMDFNAGTEERFKKAVEKFDILEQREEPEIKEEQEAQTEDVSEPEASSEDETQELIATEIPVDENFDYSKVAKFYKGNVRSGVVLNEETSLVILGDVNPGGDVVSKGNIIILGALKGNAFAGSEGNRDAFVVALNMEPMQIRIADIIARSSDRSSQKEEHEPKIAVVRNEAIAIELISRTVLNDIKI